MPYNVIGQRAGRSEIVFCKSAAAALAVTTRWMESGAGDIRVVSTEGVLMPKPRLEIVARAEAGWTPGRSEPAKPHAPAAGGSA